MQHLRVATYKLTKGTAEEVAQLESSPRTAADARWPSYQASARQERRGTELNRLVRGASTTWRSAANSVLRAPCGTPPRIRRGGRNLCTT
jgi:hypothetical protein